MTRLLLILLATLLICPPSFAQVKKVKERAQSSPSEDNSSSTETSSSSSSFGDDLLVDIIINGIGLMYIAQVNQLEKAKQDPWRVSLEAQFKAGANIQRNGMYNSQQVRGNWGLFSTEVRRFNISDTESSFTTIDWQILQFNLINVERFKWSVGLGSSHEAEVNRTHFEFTSEMSPVLFDKQIMPTLSYRISGDGTPRKEFSAMLHYRPNFTGHTEVSFQAGYTHQYLYGVEFNYIGAGVSFYLK